MVSKVSLIAALLGAALLIACGTSTPGPEGSKMTTSTGVAVSGYPSHGSRDAESPSLASSSETTYSNPTPKVPK
jgi:hypothetical protein